MRFMLAVFLALFSSAAAYTVAQPTQSNNPTSSADITLAVKLNKDVVDLYRGGNYKEALPLARRIVEITEKNFSSKDKDLRSAWRNLAEIYVALRRDREAEPFLQRLIDSYEEFAPGDPALVDVLHRMAMVQFALGNDAKTEQAYKRSVEVSEKYAGSDSALLARSLTFLGEFYQLNREPKKAEPLYARALSIREKHSPGSVSPDLGEAIHRYGCTLRKLKREEDARQLNERFFGNPIERKRAQAERTSDGGVLNGKALRLPKPPYPREAREKRAAGIVRVQVIIDETGRVVHACASSGPSVLHQVTERSAYGALFSPTTRDGEPIKVTGVITYSFKLP